MRRDKIRQWRVADVCKWLLKVCVQTTVHVVIAEIGRMPVISCHDCVIICQVEQEDLLPAFKKAGINGQSLIELMHLQISSPEYLHKALMEHIGIGEYGRVLSFSMYVRLQTARIACRYILPSVRRAATCSLRRRLICVCVYIYIYIYIYKCIYRRGARVTVVVAGEPGSLGVLEASVLGAYAIVLV